MATSTRLQQNEQLGYQPEPGYLHPPAASWSARVSQQQPQSPVYGAQNGETLPPPPWESQSPEANQPFIPQYSPSMQSSPLAGRQSPSFQGGMQHPFAPQPIGTDQVTGMYNQQMTGQMPVNNPQSMQRYPGMYPPQHYPAQMMGMVPQGMPLGQMGSMYPNQMGGYGYGYAQQPDALYLDQRMYGMSSRDDSSLRNSSGQTSMASYLPPMNQKPKHLWLW